MLKIEISNEGNATTQAEGKLIDLVFQSTVAVATIIGMAKESFGEDLPHIEDFIILEAQRIAKTKEHKVDNHRTESEPSGKRTDNPISELFNKIFGGGGCDTWSNSVTKASDCSSRWDAERP